MGKFKNFIINDGDEIVISAIMIFIIFMFVMFIIKLDNEAKECEKQGGHFYHYECFKKDIFIDYKGDYIWNIKQ